MVEFTLYFIEDFYISVHQGYWPIVFFFVESFYEFGIRIMLVEGIWS